MSVGTYHATATATGVWAHQLVYTTPDVPIADVVDQLAQASSHSGIPLTGYARTGGEFASSLLLVRDPSLKHGVPTVEECERATAMLAREGWRSRGQMVRASILIGLGLREGYAPAARVHTPAEFQDRISRHSGAWIAMPAELISARPLPRGAMQTYHEPGVMTFANWEELPAIAAIARDFRQQRFVIHDWLANRTTALSRTGKEHA